MEKEPDKTVKNDIDKLKYQQYEKNRFDKNKIIYKTSRRPLPNYELLSK